MKFLRFLGKIGFCLAVCAGLAGADSLQLRNGRHIQGKYIGGTSTAIGFMSGASVDYFATTDVLAIIFENASDSPLGGIQQPKPMTGSSQDGAERVTGPHTFNASTRIAQRSSLRSRKSLRSLRTSASTSPSRSSVVRRGTADASLSQTSTNGESDQIQSGGLTLVDGVWPLSL